MFVEHDNPIELAKELFWLAWKESRVIGMGIFQDDPKATKEAVWKSLEGDYLRKRADYVFGRMMKLYIEILPGGVEIHTREPRSDYQSWCVTYPTIQSLVDAAVVNV